MTTIHAYKRTGATPIDLGGKIYAFKPNPAGDVVCEVEDAAHAAALLEITEGFRVHKAAGTEDDDGPSPYILTMEGEGGAEKTIDLRELNKKQLQEFCVENEITFSAKATDSKLRDAIVEFMTTAE